MSNDTISQRKISAPVIVGISGTSNLNARSSFVMAEGTAPIEVGTRKFWLDGSVVFNGSCLLRTPDLAAVIPSGVQYWTIQKIANWWASSARNPGALYIEDSVEGWSACLPDPLGGAIAFSYQSAGKSFISTDTVQLVEVARDHEIYLDKDPLFQIERLLLGSGGLTNSSYRDVKSIAPFQYLILDRGQILTRDYDVLDRLKEYSLYELFTELRSDVLSAVHAIANSTSEQVISHLTGGFDSRLVLSAILNLGLKEDVSLFCSGPEGSTDRVVADGLTREFGLKRTNGAGLTNAPTQNMSERLMGALFASGGVTSTGPTGREMSVPVSAMGGGYGEVLRTFFGNRKITNSQGQVDHKLLIGSFIPISGMANSFISNDAIKSIAGKLTVEFDELNDKYNDSTFLGDAFYTHNRNRYHIGQTSLLWSRVGSRFDPLYSVAGFELSRRMTQMSREANIIGHDLLDSFHSDLLSFPFDYDRYSSSLLELRHRKKMRPWSNDATKIEFQEALTPEVAPDSPFLATMRRLSSVEPVLTAQERKVKLAESNKLGVNFWQVVYKETGQDLLRNAFEQTLGDSIHQVIDSDYIISLTRNSVLNKKQLRDLYSIGGVLSWLSFG